MALPKEDEMLLAGLYDQTMARRGGRSGSPSLNRMQSFDPAINPPPAPREVAPAQRMVSPAALTAKPATQSPSPRFSQGPAPKTALAQPNIHIGGRGGVPIPIAQAGHGRGAAAQTPLPAAKPVAPAAAVKRAPNVLAGNNPDLAIPSGLPARPASYGRVLSGQEAPATGETPAGPLGKITQTGRNSFGAPDDAGTVTLADARNAGKSGYGLSVVGKGLSPADTLADLKGQVAEAELKTNLRNAGFKDTAEGREDYQKHRQKRSRDSEIYQLSQTGISPEQAAGAIFQRDAALAQQAAVSPEQSALNQQALLQGEQGLQKGAMELQQGEAAAQTLQAKRAIAEQLGALDPKDTETRSALIDQLLAYDSKVQTTQQKQAPLQQVKAFDETGLPVASTGSFNPNTGEYSQPQKTQGGAQADGVYDMPGIGKVTVRSGIAYDEKGNILQ